MDMANPSPSEKKILNHQCDFCTNKFCEKERLIFHLKIFHDMEKPEIDISNSESDAEIETLNNSKLENLKQDIHSGLKMEKQGNDSCVYEGVHYITF